MHVTTNYLRRHDSNDLNFRPFITAYNQFEHLLKTFACELINSPQSQYKLKIFEAFDILMH